MKTPVVLVGVAVAAVVVAGIVVLRQHTVALKARADSLQTALQQQLAADSAKAAAEREQADSVARAVAARPKVLTLLNSQALEVPAQQFLASTFTLDGTGSCSLTGRIVTLTGGEHKDVQVFVQTDSDFTTWKARAHPANPSPPLGIFVSPQQTKTALAVALPGTGTYHLVISNAFSLTAVKMVQAHVQVACVDGSAPR
jgi:hypothetical protein